MNKTIKTHDLRGAMSLLITVIFLMVLANCDNGGGGGRKADDRERCAAAPLRENLLGDWK